MYGIGGEGGSSVSSGGGTGAEVQGVGNSGTQAVMMGLQAKSIESQIALNNAQASRINEKVIFFLNIIYDCKIDFIASNTD